MQKTTPTQELINKRQSQYVDFEILRELLHRPIYIPSWTTKVLEVAAYLAINAAVNSIYNNNHNQEFKTVKSKIYLLDENLSKSRTWELMKKIHRTWRINRENRIIVKESLYFAFLGIGVTLYSLFSEPRLMNKLLAKKEIWARMLESGAATLSPAYFQPSNCYISPVDLEEQQDNSQLRQNLRIGLFNDLGSMFDAPFFFAYWKLLSLASLSSPISPRDFFSQSHCVPLRPDSSEEMHAAFCILFNTLGDLIEFNLSAPLNGFLPGGLMAKSYDHKYQQNLFDFNNLNEMAKLFPTLLADAEKFQTQIDEVNLDVWLGVPQDYRNSVFPYAPFAHERDDNVAEESKKVCL